MIKKILTSNRFLGLVIFLLTIGLIYGLYVIFFVEFVGTLEINSNIKNYKVELYSKNIYTKFNYNCPEEKCVIKNLSPFEYELTIIKENYKIIKEDIKIIGKKIKKIDINLEKDTRLEEIREKSKEISEIDFKEKKVEIDGKGVFSLKLENNRINFYKTISEKQTKIASFPLNRYFLQNIHKIEGNNKRLFLEIGNEKYIYNLETNNLNKINFSPRIFYIKKGFYNGEYQIITDLGTYIFDEKTNSLNYFSLFKDFIYKDGYYLGIIFSDEKYKFKNLSIKQNSKNIIVKYNPNSKERKVVYETNLGLEKIINSGDGVYFYDEKGKKYKLNNY